MRRLPLALAVRIQLLAVIAACSALVVDYKNAGSPAFCGAGSGCLAVRLSPITTQIRQVLPVPIPNVGLVAFLALFGLSMVARTRLQLRVLAGLSIAGALFGATFFALQAIYIKVFCPFCVVVDLGSIGIAVAATLLAFSREGSDEVEEALAGTRARLLWSAVAALAIGAPFVWAEFPVLPPMPPDIQAQQVPGKVTLVMFTDFECPFCRQLHPVIRELESEFEGRIRLVRHMMPLPMHPGATPAALLYLCAPERDRERVADALYTVDPEQLTRAGCIELGVKLGLDREAITRGFDAPETWAALERDKAMFERLGQAGLPRTFVGARVVMGFDPDRLRLVVEREIGGKRPELPPSLMYVALGFLYAAAAGLTLRAARARDVSAPAG
jgi:predicted DsbA family dithiol-disulfide isomerase/uncharacterized membrane protein